jgi:hypothetical protein
MRERNAGNHADKTSPPVFHGMPGWGESGGTYPFLLETDFRDAQVIDFARGIFHPVSSPLVDAFAPDFGT